MQINLINLFYIPIIFSLILVIYRLIKVKNLDNKAMVLLSILVAILPFSPLALMGGVMGIFGLFDEKFWYRYGFLQIIISLWYLGGIVGLTGLIRSLLGYHTKYEFWMLVHGTISYIVLFLLATKAIIEEGMILELYNDYVHAKIDNSFIFMVGVTILYSLMSLYILFWHSYKVYVEIYQKKY